MKKPTISLDLVPNRMAKLIFKLHKENYPHAHKLQP